MELRHLRYFTAVAEELHFGRAAARLNMAQPPLSQQIQKLESELGTVLFERTKRSVALTEAGQAFLRRARLILASADQAAVEVQRIGRGEMGRLAVGFMSAAMLDQFPPILSAFRERLPAAQVELVQAASDEQLARVAAGHLDAGFVDLAEGNGAIEANGAMVSITTVWHERWLAALAPHHALANRARIDLAELAGERFITLPRGPATGFHDQVIGLCQEAGFSPEFGQEVSQLPAALALIGAGYGVGLMPACVCRGWRELISFVELTMRRSTAVTMIWRADNGSPVLAAFREAATAESPRLIEAALRRP